MTNRPLLISTCLLLPLRALAAAVPALALAEPAAAQAELNVAQYLAVGGFASEVNANARAVIAPAGPGVVQLNFYGVERGRSRMWFSTALRPAPNGRDLVGAWRDPSGFLFANVRVTPLDHKRAIKVSFDEPKDSVATQSLPFLHLGVFDAEKLGGNWTGKDVAGRWYIERGTVDVLDGASHLVALVSPPPGAGATRRFVAETQTFDQASGAVTYAGRWEEIGGLARGQATLNFPADRQRFTGEIVEGGTPRAWTGSRTPHASPQPTQPPVVTPPPPVAEPPQPAPQPGPVVPASFKPLRRFDVRLDRLWEARGYPTRQVHAFVTIRNAAAQAQYITSGFLRAVLTDGDGAAQERNQVWRASAEPAAVFNSTPVVQPGAELKIRYVFTPDDGSRPASLTLSEGDKRADFPAGGF